MSVRMGAIHRQRRGGLVQVLGDRIDRRRHVRVDSADIRAGQHRDRMTGRPEDRHAQIGHAESLTAFLTQKTCMADRLARLCEFLLVQRRLALDLALLTM